MAGRGGEAARPRVDILRIRGPYPTAPQAGNRTSSSRAPNAATRPGSSQSKTARRSEAKDRPLFARDASYRPQRGGQVGSDSSKRGGARRWAEGGALSDKALHTRRTPSTASSLQGRASGSLVLGRADDGTPTR